MARKYAHGYAQSKGEKKNRTHNRFTLQEIGLRNYSYTQKWKGETKADGVYTILDQPGYHKDSYTANQYPRCLGMKMGLQSLRRREIVEWGTSSLRLVAKKPPSDHGYHAP